MGLGYVLLAYLRLYKLELKLEDATMRSCVLFPCCFVFSFIRSTPSRISILFTNTHANNAPILLYFSPGNHDPNEVCGICQSAYEGVAPGGRWPGEDCPVVWGKCSHSFHLQCVVTWLNGPTARGTCPICRQEWALHEAPEAQVGGT